MIAEPTPPLRSSRDVAAITRTLAEAFSNDSVMAWLFPLDMPDRPRYLENFFRIQLEMFFTHGGVAWTTPNHEAALVWTPPGQPNMSKDEEVSYHQQLERNLGDAYQRVALFLRALDEQKPPGLPAAYMHVMFAGRRPGHSTSADIQAVTVALRDTVIREGIDVYAEASSPRNLQLWELLGFERIGEEIHLPDGGPAMYPIFGNANGRREHSG